MKKTILTGLTGLLLMAGLTSCGPGQRKSDKKVKLLFEQQYESKDPEIKGGTYKQAIISSSPFSGQLLSIFQYVTTDGQFSAPIEPKLFTPGKDFIINENGMAKIDVDVDNKIVTVTLRDNLKWDDGEPLTIDDYIYTYEVLGHPDYTGVRYNSAMANVVGMQEYHEGKAKSISGLEKVSNTQVKIHFKNLSPSIYNGSGGLTTYLLPKHHLQDVPVKDLEKSEKARTKVVGAGPYKINQIVVGESIEYVPNPYYYEPKEKPRVDKLIIKIIPSTSALASIKNGEFDTYSGVPADLYPEYKDFNNIVILGRPSLSYSYIGFNLGHWDKEKNENITDTNAKMYDLNLRKAMGYAVNMDLIIKSFFDGLGLKANGVIPPVFDKYYNPKPRFNYDPEKAKELLEKAGYKDVDGDGYREDKNGKPLEIFMAYPAGSEIAEPLAQQFIQDWKNVGLKVSLVGGRLLETNSFFERVKASDKAIDVWIANWSVGTSLDLGGIYGRNSQLNVSRLTSKKNDELIDKTNSIEALRDPEYRIKAIREWEENYLENELGYLPIKFGYAVSPYNKRIKFATASYNSDDSKGKYDAVTATEPFKFTK